MQWLWLQLCAVLLIASSAASDPKCEINGDTRQCLLPSPPQRLSLIGGKLIVGAVDHLFAFGLDLTYLNGVELSPSADRSHKCEFEQRNELCRNFIRVVQRVPGSARILVCGTNAFSPKCRFHNESNLSDWTFLSAPAHQDVGFSPYSNDSSVALLASNGRFFTTTLFVSRHAQKFISMAPEPLKGNATFTVRTPNSGILWLNLPTFISVYEVGEWVYFFALEPAYEVDNGLAVVYSRVIRMCKNDTGFRQFPTDPALTFLTFQKARLKCTQDGELDSIPFDYDRLRATYLLHFVGQEPVLYGAFSSPANGPEGAAICKFSFGQIQSVFEDGEYLVFKGNNRWTRATADPFVCPGQEGSQRSEQQAKEHQLIFSAITPLEPQPIFRMTGEEITQLAVDVATYQGHPLEVMLAALKSGAIVQVVVYDGKVYKASLRGPGDNIQDLLVTRQGGEVRLVVLTTANTVESLSLGNCSKHSSCADCLLSRDPYCGWNDSAGCVNKMVAGQSSSLTDSVTVSDAVATMVCGSPLPPVQSSVCARSSSLPSSISSSEGSETVSSSNPTHTPSPPSVDANQRRSDRGQEDAGLLTGVTVVGFVLGVPVGLAICYLFFRTFLKWNKPSSSKDIDTPGTENICSSGRDENDNVGSLENSNFMEDRGASKHDITCAPPEQASIHTQMSQESDVFKRSLSNDVFGPIPNDEVFNPKPSPSNEVFKPSPSNEVFKPSTSNEVFKPSPSNKVFTPSLGNKVKSSPSNRVTPTELPIKAGHIPSRQGGLQVPGYRVPRGRTESTTWLTANESSDYCPDLGPISPV